MSELSLKSQGRRMFQEHNTPLDDDNDFLSLIDFDAIDVFYNNLESSHIKVSTPPIDHCTTEKVADETLFNKKDESLKDSVDHSKIDKVVDITLDATPSNLNNNTKRTLPAHKKRGRWTQEEQRLFLTGIERYGWGKWKNISEHVVVTRTMIQVASHAQKYKFRKNALKEKKKRKTMHDMNLSDNEAMVLPNIDQQNCGVFTPSYATMQPQQVQQLPCNMPHQMSGVQYGDVKPHYMQNWVPSPIQPYVTYPTSGYRYFNNEFLNGRSFAASN